MASSLAVICLNAHIEPEHSRPDARKLVSGDPQLSLWNYYSDPTQQFFAGVWAATRGSWRIHYSESEFCHLLSGRVAVSNEAGQRWEFGPGDSFVVPRGFVGIWEVIEDCRKAYAIFEPAQGLAG
jgi:uncharacterized protein